jgi:hypothetical protein
MTTATRDRLDGRNGLVWQAYLSGATQDAIAVQFGISQSRVSRIIIAVRESIPPVVLDAIAKVEADRLSMLYEETMKILHGVHPLVSIQRGKVIFAPYTASGVLGADDLDDNGEPVGAKYVPLEDVGPKLAAINTALRIHERIAKTYGLDAPTKVEATGTVKFILEGVDVDAI